MQRTSNHSYPLFAAARDQAEDLFERCDDSFQSQCGSESKLKYEQLVKSCYNFFADSSKRDVFYKAVVDKARSGLGGVVWQNLKRLQKYLKRRCSDWPPVHLCPFLLSIDKVHVLYTGHTKDTESDHTLYLHLKSVLCEGVSHPIAVVSLSTASRVSSVAPSKEVAPSLRERADERILPAPFMELPFGVHLIADPLSCDEATLDTVGSLEFTAKFGRPL